MRRSAVRTLAGTFAGLGALALAGCASVGAGVGSDGAGVGIGGRLGDIAGSVGGVIGGGEGALSGDEIVRGLKAALEQGSSQVVAALGRPGGFADDPVARIPLPESLRKAADFADRVGLGSYFDELQGQLNAAAEQATPKAKSLFAGAIREMSIDDARGILSGPDDAATQYFRRTTGEELAASMRPIVDESLAQVGAVATLNGLLERYRSLPLAPAIDADLTGYVTDEAQKGIFHYLAEQEKAIRENPVERTSAILQRVFGAR